MSCIRTDAHGAAPSAHPTHPIAALQRGLDRHLPEAYNAEQQPTIGTLEANPGGCRVSTRWPAACVAMQHPLNLRRDVGLEFRADHGPPPQKSAPTEAMGFPRLRHLKEQVQAEDRPQPWGAVTAAAFGLGAGADAPCPHLWTHAAARHSGASLDSDLRGVPSPSNRRADPVVRWRASSRTVSRRITRPWRSSRRRCCSFINDAISSTLSFIRITVVSAERMRSVTLMAARPGQRAHQPRPHPGSVLCGWC